MSEPIGWAQDYIDAFDALIKLGEEHPGYYEPHTMLTLRARRQHWIDVREHEKQARKQKVEAMRDFVNPLEDPNGAHKAEQMLEHTADVLAWYR